MSSEGIKEFKVNEYITLKLENDKTNIYVAGNMFRQCKFLLLDIPVENITFLDKIESIDEAAEILDKSLEQIQNRKIDKIDPKIEFWGHCSNLQGWAENGYNTRLLHSNLAFPLLKRLTEVGDTLAKRIFKEEIAKRIESKNPIVLKYLISEGYTEYLTKNEISSINSIVNEFKKNYFERLELEESYFLRDFEKLIENPIPFVYENNFAFNGYYSYDGHIIQLRLSSLDLMYLPNSIGNLKSLEVLQLHNNKLNALPSSIGQLSSLRLLEIPANNLLKLPASIGNLQALQELNLNNNKLSNLPESIGNLKSLDILSLTANTLSTLPKSIENLKSLTELLLNDNEFASIPEFIGNITSLFRLDISKNKLVELPESIKQLSSLKELYISNNKIKFLPKWLGKFTFLYKLDISQNPIENQPFWVENLRRNNVIVIS